MRVVADGVTGAKQSRTEFRVLERYTHATLHVTLIEARPITGRTHQIRVHCQTAGHSIIGDDKYGNRDRDHHFRDLGFKRLCLHASQLNFVGYSGKTVNVVAQLDAAWQLAQAKLTPVYTVGWIMKGGNTTKRDKENGEVSVKAVWSDAKKPVLRGFYRIFA